MAQAREENGDGSSGSEVDSETGSVTADVLGEDDYDEYSDSDTNITAPPASVPPASASTFSVWPPSHPLRLEQAALFDGRPRVSTSTLLQPSRSYSSERTPTAKYFNLTLKVDVNVNVGHELGRDVGDVGNDGDDGDVGNDGDDGDDGLTSPRTAASGGSSSRSSPQTATSATSQVSPISALPSPWDDPVYSRAPSPVPDSDQPGSATHQHFSHIHHGHHHHPSHSHHAHHHHRPHLQHHHHHSSPSAPGSSNLHPHASLQPHSGGIQKHGSNSTASKEARRKSASRLSGSFHPPASASWVLDNDERPLWQQQLSRSSSSSGRRGGASSSMASTRPTSRRNSRDVNLENVHQAGDGMEVSCPSPLSIYSNSSTLPSARPYDEDTASDLQSISARLSDLHLQQQSSSNLHPCRQSQSPRSTSGTDVITNDADENRFDADKVGPPLVLNNTPAPEQHFHSGGSRQSNDDRFNDFDSTPLAIDLPLPPSSQLSQLPTTPQLQNQTSQLPSFVHTSPDYPSRPDMVAVDPPIPFSTGRTRSRSGSLVKSPLRPSLGIPHRGRSGSLRSINRTQYTVHKTAEPDEHLKAHPVDARTLLHRIQDGWHGFKREILLLDLRPLHSFIAVCDHEKPEGNRIRGSVNVNFPSLLIKRFRKGNVSSFTLESFITTQAGQAIYSSLSSSGTEILAKDSNLDICVLDEHITPKDFATLSTSGSVGAVLVTALEKRRVAAQTNSVDAHTGGEHRQGKLWYLEGESSSLFALAKDSPGMLASGSDENDKLKLPVSSSQSLGPINGSSPSDNLLTPTFPSNQFSNSVSDTDLTSSSELRKRSKPLPQLSLPITTLFRGVRDQHSRDSYLPPTSPGFAEARFSRLDIDPVEGQKRRLRPAFLTKLDTSDRIRQPSSTRDLATKEAPPHDQIQDPQSYQSLAPKRSFQEIAIAQGATPTRTNFVAPANSQPIHSIKLDRGSDDYENRPPPLSVYRAGHPSYIISDRGRSLSVDSTDSISSDSQYPPIQPILKGQTNLFGTRNGFLDARTPNKGSAVPFSMSVIIPGFLYLGPEPTRLGDVEELESVGIKRILNMAVECDTQERWKGRFEKIACIPMRDSLAEVNVQDRIREACVLLDDADLHDKPTYVHCKAGKSRSVTIVLAYLIHRNHWPLKRAYAHVSERRKGVSPNIGFVAELMRFEENELGAKSQGVLGSGNTPAQEQPASGRNRYFRGHARTPSNDSFNSTDMDSSLSAPIQHGSPEKSSFSPQSARSEAPYASASYLPTSLEGRPSIVRHLSLIANTAMNLTSDQAASKGVKEAKLAARARIRESLPPNVGGGVSGWVTTANTPTGGCTPVSSPSVVRGQSRTELGVIGSAIGADS